MRWLIWLTSLALAGCTALQPRSQTVTQGQWKDFDHAKKTFDQIEPNKTTRDQLRELGYDPFKHPNIVILSYADILRRFTTATTSTDQLDDALRSCLAAREACSGYELEHKNIRRQRNGNFFLDYMNFQRRTETSGWKFNAVVVLQNDVVVYKLWGGQPQISEMEKNTNPLGPLQGLEKIR